MYNKNMYNPNIYSAKSDHGLEFYVTSEQRDTVTINSPEAFISFYFCRMYLITFFLYGTSIMNTSIDKDERR